MLRRRPRRAGRGAAATARSASAAWLEAPMTPLGNDRWAGSVHGRARSGATNTPSRAGSIASRRWRHELAKKFDAGQDVVERAARRRELLSRAAGRAAAADAAPALMAAARTPRRCRDVRPATGSRRRCDAALAEAMTRESGSPRRDPLRSASCGSRSSAARARFGAWYEMFPRSAGPDPTRSATFAEAAARLPYIAAMGFDVLYLPPIHPDRPQLPQGARTTR